jgi:uncharacterized protein YbjT (DUF2867 family)
MHIIIAGATGLVGRQLLALLSADIRVSRITSIGRRAVDLVAPKLSCKTGDIADWPHLVAEAGADIAISTLGTTLKQAGSREAFAAVDFDAVTGFASAAQTAGARQFLMVSSVGASAASSNFYLQTKGRAEDAVRVMAFDRVDIFRPGLLRGDRGGPVRIGERIGMAVSPFTDLLTPRAFDKYRSIAASDVASAIARRAGAAEKGVFVHHHREMMPPSA